MVQRNGRSPEGDGPEAGPTKQSDLELDTRLADLKSHLDREDKVRKEAEQTETGKNQANWVEGLKLGSEFVAGVLVGAGIGYVLDGFLGSSPWGLIVFLMLGFAAGVLNVLRSVGAVAKPLDRSRRTGSDGGVQKDG